MFVAQKPIKYYEPRRGGTLIKLFKGTCRPYGLRSSFSALCYKHAAPTEIHSRRNFNGLMSYYFAFLLSPFNFSIAFSKLCLFFKTGPKRSPFFFIRSTMFSIVKSFVV